MPEQTKRKPRVDRAEPTAVGSDSRGATARRQARRVVVVGVPGDVPRALEHPAVGRGAFIIGGVLAVDIESEEGIQGLERLAAMLAAHQAEAILVAGPIGASTMQRVADLALLNHCDLLAVMPTEVLASHDPVIVWSGESPLVQLAGLPRKRFESEVKRVMDVVGAAVGLLLCAPVIALLAAIVRIESPGAPIFRHVRVGRNGKPFDCLKLRTMRADAEDCLRRDPELYDEYVRNHYKLPERRDPRVTPFGRFLRRTSLDELPQLWNVLIGDMSLVGPRPVVEEELALYDNGSQVLLSVRPGLTGAWAVSGRHRVGYPDRCAIELEYVRRWNLRRDVGIIVKTLGVVVMPDAADRRGA